MDLLPRALENILTVLLCEHTISSWKIAAQGPNPTIVLRLMPTDQSQEHGYRAQTKTYRTKPPSQVERDRRRAVQFRQKCDLAVDKNIACDMRKNHTNSEENQSANEKNTNRDRLIMCSETVLSVNDTDPHLSREAMRTGLPEYTADFDSTTIAAECEQMDQQSGRSVDSAEGTCVLSDRNAEDTLHEEERFDRDCDWGGVILERETSVPFESTPRADAYLGQGFDSIDSIGDSDKERETSVVEGPPRDARERLSQKQQGRGHKNGGGRVGLAGDDKMTVNNTSSSHSFSLPSGVSNEWKDEFRATLDAVFDKHLSKFKNKF